MKNLSISLFVDILNFKRKDTDVPNFVKHISSFKEDAEKVSILAVIHV
jgi:hypothetical protein